MKKGILVDTDVFIDFLRGYPDAVDFIKRIYPDIHISTISIAELYTGIRDGVERDSLDAAIEACHVVDVTGVIARKAGLWQRTYGKSHGVHLPDALIAATVQEWSLTLATLNRRHFPMLADIVTPYGKSR